MLENMAYVGVGFATVSSGAGPGGTDGKGASSTKTTRKSAAAAAAGGGAAGGSG